MNLDEFLGHSSSARGGGTKTLNWKKRTPPAIETWLHTKAPFIALWRHGWPRIVELDRDGSKTREVWTGTWNCWEPESVLKTQNKRRDDDSRVNSPKVCPICLAIEHVRAGVRSGKIDWLQPIFKFGEGETELVLCAAGLFNAFNNRQFSRQEITEMRAAGVSQKEAWKQNTMAKCSYVMSIVDQDEPEKGVQVAIETTALGDAVKKAIADRIEQMGRDEGHPALKPYAIKWEYRPNEQEFSKKYRALVLPKVALSEAIRELIVDLPPPDISDVIERGNVASLRASMEAHAQIDMPWDEIFGPAEGSSGVAPKQESEAPAQRRTRQAPAAAKPAKPEYPPGTVTLPCDKCGAEMADHEDTCWNCGAKYVLDADEKPVAKPAAQPKVAAPKTQWAGENTEEDDLGW